MMGSQESYPGSKGSAAKRLIDRDRLAERAFDRREEWYFDRAVSLGRAALEHARIEAILRRDREDRSGEIARASAEIEVATGRFANLADTAVAPTREWLGKGAVRAFTPRSPDGTTRAVRTVRRVRVPVVLSLEHAGALTFDQARACLWYRVTHEMAGLDGAYASGRYGAEAGMPTGQSLPRGHMASTERQAEARRQFRSARGRLSAAYVRFFDAIVLGDIAPRRAARLARCRNGREKFHLRQQAQRLSDHLDEMGIDLSRVDEI